MLFSNERICSVRSVSRGANTCLAFRILKADPLPPHTNVDRMIFVWFDNSIKSEKSLASRVWYPKETN